MPVLVISTFRGPFRLVEVSTDPLLIGRGAGADLQISDGSVSRRHARVCLNTGTGVYMVEDCGSSNGTLLDGERISGPQPLDDGSVLCMGLAQVRFQEREAGLGPDDARALDVTDELPTTISIARRADEGV